MSTWQRIDRDGEAHALNAEQDKRARQKFGGLYQTTKTRALAQAIDELDDQPDHLTIGQRSQDGTGVRLIATHWGDLHGPDGVCTCCPRSAA